MFKGYRKSGLGVFIQIDEDFAIWPRFCDGLLE